jgi:hypothetical protein
MAPRPTSIATSTVTDGLSASGTDSATSTTTGSVYSCTVALIGTLSEPRRSEDGYHA